MNDEIPPVNPADFDVSRMNALLGHSPAQQPQWAMAWFGGQQPYGGNSVPGAYTPPPSPWPAIGLGITGLAVITTIGFVAANHLNSTREAALKNAIAQAQSLRQERDKAITQILEARTKIDRLRQEHEKTCQAQADSLAAAANVLGTAP